MAAANPLRRSCSGEYVTRPVREYSDPPTCTKFGSAIAPTATAAAPCRCSAGCAAATLMR
eukprot:6194607-Pleurochrysis_carterae.AAC.3